MDEIKPVSGIILFREASTNEDRLISYHPLDCTTIISDSNHLEILLCRRRWSRGFAKLFHLIQIVSFTMDYQSVKLLMDTCTKAEIQLIIGAFEEFYFNQLIPTNWRKTSEKDLSILKERFNKIHPLALKESEYVSKDREEVRLLSWEFPKGVVTNNSFAVSYTHLTLPTKRIV